MQGGLKSFRKVYKSCSESQNKESAANPSSDCGLGDLHGSQGSCTRILPLPRTQSPTWAGAAPCCGCSCLTHSHCSVPIPALGSCGIKTQQEQGQAPR